MRIPIATYRLQVNDGFTLRDAAALVPYLAHLGVSDLYLSPVFEARPGSTHGYDVTDPTRIRESIGGVSALRSLAAEAHRHHMGILLDIVPNHMAASSDNPWWRDVLRHGRESRYAHFFDIAWSGAPGHERILLPILGDTIDALIQRGDITLDAARNELLVQGARLPLAPGDYTAVDVRAVLDRQHYQLVAWKRASEEVFYRRFFDISDLAAVRVEDDDVFEATHALIRELAAEGVISGIRIDHIDGLRDPTAYLRTLREHVRGPDGRPLYTIVEKILAHEEKLPQEWECEGTTGYEFLTLANRLLISPQGYAGIDAFHRRITGDTRAFGELVREKKLLVMNALFGGELASLGCAVASLADADPDESRTAIAEVTASMSVYRTYTRDMSVRPDDRQRIDEAATDAMTRAESEPLRRAIDRVRRVALLEGGGTESERLDWVMRWQQFSGPVMAKGLEDTALYCHNAFLAVNDVGSDPADPALARADLLDALQQRSRSFPLALNATATHDTKRGEDTRARIAVLSELPDEWRSRLRHWIRTGDEWKAELGEDDEPVTPSADVESLLYQTLLGAWPMEGATEAFRERIKSYMMKAVREAKEQTSWRRPDEDYEQALRSFIERLMQGFGREGLADNVGSFAHRLAPHGAINSITQMLLKVTAPGIPDFYQGTELWSFTLVDPDNRANIDFEQRTRLFDDITHLRDTPDGDSARDLLGDWQDGRIKLLLTALALRFRASHRAVFEHGEVVPLQASGPAAAHVFAFARRVEGRACITVLPRWSASLGDTAIVQPGQWGDTTIPLPADLRNAWHDALTNSTLPAADALYAQSLFTYLPFALLELSQPIGA